METIKKFANWIVVGVLAIAAFIYYLLQEVSGLKAQMGRAKAEKEMGVALSNLEEGKKNADEKEADFRKRDADLASAMDEYRKGSGKLPD